ncbi:hypothetical protein [Streptosporangium canum]|uniref:hypothetical protein n=1 Tax=Streptosporangium canum TaxID=324952 RepID=UPI003791ED4B
MIAERGWPGKDMVGETGADAAWLLAQHADQDPQLQRDCLPLLQAAGRRGSGSAIGAGVPRRPRPRRRWPLPGVWHSVLDA